MARIPQFTRTVLPNTAQPGNIQSVRRQDDLNADAALRQGEVNTAQIRQRRDDVMAAAQAVEDYSMREIEARNATAVNEGMIRHKRVVAETLDQARQERLGNPENFADDFDRMMQEREDEMLKAAPSEIARQALQEQFSRHRGAAFEENIGWTREQQAKNFASSIERSADDLQVMAYRAGKSGRTNIDDLMENVEASTIAGATIVSPENVKTIRETMRRGVINSMIEGLTTSNPYEAKKALNSGVYDKDLTADDLSRLDKMTTAEIDRRKAEARADFSHEFEDFKSAMKLGVKIDKDILETQAKRASILGMENQAKAIRDYVEVQDQVSAYAVKPMVDQEAELVTIKNDIEAGNVSRVQEFSAKMNVLKVKRESLAREPFNYYAAHEIIQAPKPIDFSNGEAMAEEVQNRRVMAQRIKDIDGVDVSLFTGPEIDGMKKVFEQAGPDEASQLFSAIGSQLLPGEKKALARAVNIKSPILAAAIAVDDPKAGERVLMGAKAKISLPAEDVRSKVDEMLGGAVYDPEILEPIHAATYAYYKAEKLMSNEAEVETLDEDTVEKALNAIVGPPVEVGNSKVLSFRGVDGRFVDEDELDDLLYGITDDQLKALNGKLPEPPAALGGGVLSAERLKNKGRFVSAGDGQYMMIVDGLGYASDKDGRPYVIDARKLMELQKTMPKGKKPAQNIVAPSGVIVGP